MAEESRRRPYDDDRAADLVSMAVIKNDLSYIKEAVKGLDNKVSTHFVTKEEFEPIKKIVYGLVGLILVAVVGALVGLVLQ